MAKELLVLTVTLLMSTATGCLPGTAESDRLPPPPVGAETATAGVPAQATPRLQVLTSIAVLADLARNVGGDRVEVRSLVPAGTDVHTFQPTPRDLEMIAAASVVFLNGLGLEQAAGPIIRNNVGQGVPVVELTDGLETVAANGHDEDDRETQDGHDSLRAGDNPHLWLDPRNAARYVEKIRDTLSVIDRPGAEIYRQNTETYLARLRELDREIEAQLAAIPPQRRKLVAFHDAFPYLARRYGLELVGVVLKSPGREPSAQEVAELVQRIRDLGVPAVYTEPQFNARILELAARDAGVRVLSLYSDALDQRVSTYVEMMRYNARQLADGLK